MEHPSERSTTTSAPTTAQPRKTFHVDAPATLYALEADDFAWERAHDHYLALFEQFSDVQEQRPRNLRELELEATP